MNSFVWFSLEWNAVGFLSASELYEEEYAVGIFSPLTSMTEQLVDLVWFSLEWNAVGSLSASALFGDEYGISPSDMNDGLNFSIMYGSLWWTGKQMNLSSASALNSLYE